MLHYNNTDKKGERCRYKKEWHHFLDRNGDSDDEWGLVVTVDVCHWRPLLLREEVGGVSRRDDGGLRVSEENKMLSSRFQSNPQSIIMQPVVTQNAY